MNFYFKCTVNYRKKSEPGEGRYEEHSFYLTSKLESAENNAKIEARRKFNEDTGKDKDNFITSIDIDRGIRVK